MKRHGSTVPDVHCTRCGRGLGREASFCQWCGQKIVRLEEEGDIGAILPELEADPEWRPRQRNRQVGSYVKEELVEEDSTWQTVASREKLARRPEEIKQEVQKEGVEFESLPEPVKRILLRREYYVVKYKFFEEQEGEYGKNDASLPLGPSLISSFEALGTKRLYKFQEEATLAILKGENVVITAPTGNGKTLAFAVPIFQSIISESKNRVKEEASVPETVRSIFVYPTKALARDQLKILQKFADKNISIEIFDGDTPRNERNRILDSPPNIIITNFDVLEYHLRNRTRFAAILRDLQFVVIDELHTYLGAFGSHVYFILRRLQRIQRKENTTRKIQFIGASATVRNPKQFAELLFNSKVTEIRCEKGRRGRIHFVMLYPSATSMTGMIVSCVRALLSAEMKTLVFANTHRNAEVLNLALKRERLGSEIHRAGLLRNQRTWVEESFRNGTLRSLVATPTLELGIDIGDLDSVVSMITGITTLTQRMGRAGRKGQDSIVVLALRDSDPISAFYKNHPDIYFSDINAAYVEPHNTVVSRLELLAAALDMPLHPNEFPDQNVVLTHLKKEKLLGERLGRLWVTPDGAKEANQISIRGIGESVSILLENPNDKTANAIGERTMPMALRELFPHAIYLLAGRKYESISFKNTGGLYYANVKRLPDSVTQKTEALRYPDPKIVKVLETISMRGMEVSYCELTMTEVVEGYLLKDMFTDKKLGPPKMLSQPLTYTYPTKGFVFCAPQPSKKSLSQSKKDKTDPSEDQEEHLLGGSFHALEHALIESSDSITGSGSSEIGGVSVGTSGMIFVYDGSPGGSGLTRLLFDRLHEALSRTLTILKECSCSSSDGCPLCTYSYQCGNNNEPLNKLGAIDSLEQILKGTTTKIKEDMVNQQKSYL